MAGVLALLAVALAAAAPAPWQVQLQGRIDTSVRAHFFDIDGSASAKTVRALHRRGRKVACYISAGSWEAFRSDRRAFPPEVLGRRYAGYPDERWLDIRRIDVLAPILRARIDACKAKGFDGVDPDNLNGYENPTGFPLTAADQLRFNRWLADEVHAHGLEVGLKNDGPQARNLVRSFDWVIVEECIDQGNCGEYAPFTRAGKPVYAIEYRGPTRRACAQASRRRISVVFKTPALRARRRTCSRLGP
jgi:hypothetical protein